MQPSIPAGISHAQPAQQSKQPVNASILSMVQSWPEVLTAAATIDPIVGPTTHRFDSMLAHRQSGQTSCGWCKCTTCA